LKKFLSGIILSLLLLANLTIVLSFNPTKTSAVFSKETAQADPVDWWPMFHHDPNHTGFSTSTGPTTNNLLWTYTTGSWCVISSPAVVGGYVYVGSYSNCKVYCLSAATGTLVWSYMTDGCVGRSSSAVSGGYVYVSDYAGKLYCLSAATGTLVWSYTTGGSISPVVVGGLVYVGSWDGKVYCLNAVTGAFVWSYTTGGYVDSSPAVSGGYIYVGSWDGKVYCLNAVTGAFVWSYTTGGYVRSSPAVSGGYVYVGSYDDKVYCLSAATGTLVWSYTTGDWVDSSPAVSGGYVYVGSWDGKVYCLSAATGTLVWSYTTGDAVLSSPAVSTSYVYVSSCDGKLYCLGAATGTLVWSYTTVPGGWSSPVVVGGCVFYGSYDGKVYAFGSGGGLKIENIQPVQTLVNCSVLIPGKPTVFNMTIVSTYPYTKSGVYLLITCGSQSWYEGPLTIPGNSEIPFCTGGTYYHNGQKLFGQCYCPTGEFDVSIKIDAFSPNAQTFTKHIGPQTGYQFKNLGPLKVLYVPVGFWSGPTAWLLGDPHIPPDNMTREVTFSDSFIKAVFPVDPALYKSEIASEYPLPAPPLGDPVTRRAWAALEVAELDSVMNLYHMPSMGGYDRIILVVPSRSDDLWLKYWLNKDALGMNLVLPDSVIWCQEGYYTTPAHELWHSYTGISDAVWHCPNAATGYWDLAHSRGSSGLIDGGLPVPCMMSGGDQHYPETDWAYRWICPHCYANLTNLSRLKHCPDPEVLFVSGVVFSNDTVNLQPFYHFSEGYADLNPGTVGNYAIRFLDANQQVLSNIGFNMTFDTSLNVTGFGFAVPYPSGAAQIQLLHGNNVIASRSISANPPSVSLTYPNNGETLTSGQNITIQWQANDPDNNTLSYTVLYTPDNGSTWIPIQTDVAGMSLNWTVPNDHPTNQCRIKVVATDGINTGKAVSDELFAILRHDVAVIGNGTTDAFVGEGYTLPINVTVQNVGNYTETFNVTAYANATSIQTRTITLESGTFTTLTFTWNTTGFALGNYTISAYVWPVQNETDTANNKHVDGIVKVIIPPRLTVKTFAGAEIDGVEIWIDSEPPTYYSPVNIRVDIGWHTVKVSYGLLEAGQEEGSYIKYSFYCWDNGFASNTRSLQLNEDETIWAYYTWRMIYIW
jgi:outer membrane protein assembly factor BamB